MAPHSHGDVWPVLRYADWRDTSQTLHMWTQIAGKIRLARTPWLNHSWHVTLYVTGRGLTTSPIPDGARSFQLDFDFVDHVLWLRTSDGHFRQLVLKPMPVAEFYADIGIALRELGIDIRINQRPNEIPDAIPFSEDLVHRAYDPEYANRFWRILAPPTTCSSNSAPAFSARRARCISSGAASTLR
jgi:hypothetical protein